MWGPESQVEGLGLDASLQILQCLSEVGTQNMIVIDR